MKRLLLFLAVVGTAFLPLHGATPVWVTPDVPTDETLSGSTLLPWEIYVYTGSAYNLALSVPGNVDLNAIHKMDTHGDWLFSIEAPSDLGGALPVFAQPRDVIWYDASAGIYQFCMRGASVGIPLGAGIDSIHMAGGDAGDLIVGFDVPTDFTGFPTFEPADLVRFAPSMPGICPNVWSIVAANPDFDASAALPGVAITSSTDGADGLPGTKRILAFDIPTDISPFFVGPNAFFPGRLAAWYPPGLTWQLFETLNGWPISSVIDGVSCGGTTPGRIDPPKMVMGKAIAPAGDVVLTWPGSCASGASDYGIYEGTLGTWYSHSAIRCNDLPPLFTEQVTPLPGDRYFLVVPLNDCNGSEGSYGRCSPGQCLTLDERPIGTAVCAAPQVLPTPPACP